MNQQAYHIQPDKRVLVARPTQDECVGQDVALLVQELCSRIDADEADSVVIELCNVGYMDSACVSKLLMLRQRARLAGGSVALSTCQPNVRFLFEMTRLDKVFGLYDSTEQAVAELRDRRTRKAQSPAQPEPGTDAAPHRRHRYTPLLNALLRAHRRRFAHASQAQDQDRSVGL